MEEILISIQPQWCEKIATGKKIVEIRKSIPKITVPFKCYIYCTKGKPYLYGDNKNYVSDCLCFFKKADKDFEKTAQMYKWNGRVIGEFICDKIDSYTAEFTTDNCYEDIVLNYYNEDIEEMETQYITSNEEEDPSNCNLCKDSCILFNGIKKYLFNGTSGFFDFYGMHISNLKFYEKSKDLNEFGKYCTLSSDCSKCDYFIKEFNPFDDSERCSKNQFKPLKTAPQSWCYVDKKG